MLDTLLAPFDWSRQSAANLARSGHRLLMGDASAGDVLRAAPGAAGALTAAVFGLPTGALVGGGLQGLGRLVSPDTFEAPTAGDVVEALGGDPESMAQTTAAQVATDPLMWGGLLHGGPAAARRLLRGAPALESGLLASDLPVGFGSRLGRFSPGEPAASPLADFLAPPARLPPAPAYPRPAGPVYGTPGYPQAMQAALEADAATQAATEALTGRNAAADAAHAAWQEGMAGRVRAARAPGAPAPEADIGHLILPSQDAIAAYGDTFGKVPPSWMSQADVEAALRDYDNLVKQGVTPWMAQYLAGAPPGAGLADPAKMTPAGGVLDVPPGGHPSPAQIVHAYDLGEWGTDRPPPGAHPEIYEAHMAGVHGEPMPQHAGLRGELASEQRQAAEQWARASQTRGLLADLDRDLGLVEGATPFPTMEGLQTRSALLEQLAGDLPRNMSSAQQAEILPYHRMQNLLTNAAWEYPVREAGEPIGTAAILGRGRVNFDLAPGGEAMRDLATQLERTGEVFERKMGPLESGTLETASGRMSRLMTGRMPPEQVPALLAELQGAGVPVDIGSVRDAYLAGQQGRIQSDLAQLWRTLENEMAPGGMSAAPLAYETAITRNSLVSRLGPELGPRVFQRLLEAARPRIAGRLALGEGQGLSGDLRGALQEALRPTIPELLARAGL